MQLGCFGARPWISGRDATELGSSGRSYRAHEGREGYRVQRNQH